MSSKIKKIALFGLIGAVIGALIAYSMYFMPHQNVLNAQADKTLSSAELYETVKNIDDVAAAEFADQIFQITATVTKVNAVNDTSVVVLLALGDDVSNNIKCSMDAAYLKEMGDLQPGAMVSIKGIFSGISRFEDPDFGISTLDVELNRCVVVK